MSKFGLYHVNSLTDEVIPFDSHWSHGLTKTEADRRLTDLQLGKGRGTAYRNNVWTTEVREEPNY